MSLDLAMGLQSYEYNGHSQLPPYSRWGFSFGPIQLVRRLSL